MKTEAEKLNLTDAVGAKRLQKLANFLKTVPSSKFHLNDWIYYPNATKNKQHDLHDEIYKSSCLNMCGSTGCALGWAASMTEFRKAGLRYYSQPLGHLVPAVVKGELVCYHGYDAGSFFFHISRNASLLLFSPNNYSDSQVSSPAAVVRRIESFLNSPKSLCKTILKNHYEKNQSDFDFCDQNAWSYPSTVLEELKYF